MHAAILYLLYLLINTGSFHADDSSSDIEWNKFVESLAKNCQCAQSRTPCHTVLLKHEDALKRRYQWFQDSEYEACCVRMFGELSGAFTRTPGKVHKQFAYRQVFRVISPI